MSKIFDAYRKQMGESPDLVVEIAKAGSLSLYPGPQGRQRDEFNALANRLLGLRVPNRGMILAFSSSAADEGASFVSYNTAVFLASVFGQRVAWIDGNFLSPQAKLQGREGDTLSSLLQEPERALELVAAENPLLVPGGHNLQRVKGLIASKNYPELLQYFSRRFDFTLLDLPPILETTDTALMASATDGYLLVIEQKYLKREVIQHGVTALKNKGVQILGTVINRRSFELPKVIYERL